MDVIKLYESLKYVKDYCVKYFDEHNTCTGCPMWGDSSSSCSVVDVDPDHWELIEPCVKIIR